MDTARKINAILLNIKINRPKLVNMCRYKLATYWLNFTEIYLTRVKILQKVLGGGYFFDSHCISVTHANEKTNAYQVYTEQNLDKFHLKEA